LAEFNKKATFYCKTKHLNKRQLIMEATDNQELLDEELEAL